MDKLQITNSKSQTNHNTKWQKSQTNFGIVILVFGIVCNLLFVNWNLALYAQTVTQDEKEDESLFVAKKAFDDGFYEVALGLLERFLKNYPESKRASEANLLIGQCYFYQNKFLDALTKFEWLLERPAAKDIEDAVLYWIAEVHFRGNNFSKAASYYKKIITEYPSSGYFAAANYSLGWCLFQERDFKEALVYFKIMEEKFPQESFVKESSFKIIECLYNLKDYSQLKERLNNYLKVYAQDKAKLPYLYFYLAEADYYLNNFPEAIKEYSKVLSSTQDEKIQALSRLSIGWAYLKLKKYNEAEDMFLDINPDSLERPSHDVLLLGQAILMVETKRFDQAKKIYVDLASKTADPAVLVQAYLGKADTLYNSGSYQEALEAYKEALAKASAEIPQEIIDKLHYGLAWSYLKEGQFKEAIDEFRKVVKLSEDKIVKISALCQIGDAYQDAGNFTKAAETYDVILKDYPESLYSDYVQYQLGSTLLKSSNYDGAILAFQALKKNFPGSKLLDDASYALGLAYFQREDYKASKEIFEKFQAEHKDSYLRPQAIYLLGTSLYNLGQFREAIEVFKNVVRSYSQDNELVQKAEYEIADCFYRLGDEKEAMAKFKLLRSKYPGSSLTAEVVWWLGEYYYRHNDLDLARRYFSSLIQDFPKSSLIANAYYALGSTYAEENNGEEAISNFKKVLELGKSDLAGTAIAGIADIYLKQGKMDLALKAYEEIIKDYPNLDALAYPKIADIYRKSRDYAQSLNFYRKSLEIVPVSEMSDIQFKIAETIEAKGEPGQAIAEYLKVTYLYSENNSLTVKSLLRVAAIYEAKENFKEAASIYKRITSIDAQEAKYAVERLEWMKANRLIK